MSLPDSIQVGNLKIDLATYRLFREGEVIRLTPTEWALLRELLQHPNQVLSHRTLLKRVWGDEYDTEYDYVHTYISRLRRKLELDGSNPQYILTEAGIGYRFNGDMITLADAQPEPAPTPPNSEPASKTLHRRTINPLPQHIGERYVGRDDQLSHVKSLLLSESTRMVSIYGRAGMGKTALACKVLEDLTQLDVFNGMVYLSSTSTGITLGRILSDFGRLLGVEKFSDKPQPAVYRVSNLLDRLYGGRYLLLLDNLEHLQNPLTNDLTDDDMETFFRVVVEQGGALQILVTSRYPINLPRSLKTAERVVALEEGLSLADGVKLLRHSDPDNHAGLKDAPLHILEELVNRTHGLPRALEAAVGLLLESPLMSPDDLLQEPTLLSAEIGDVFIEGVIRTLPEDVVQVMELVSVFQRAVPLQMLEALATRSLGNSSLKSILNRLVRAFFLSYNPDDQTVAMHPIDRAYCYNRLDEEKRISLHHEIADLYAAIFDDEGQITGITELANPLSEVFHRVNAQEFEQAAHLLLELDREYLSIWGNYAELVDNYSRIVDSIDNSRLFRQVRLRQGEALRRVGRLHEAIICFEQVNKLSDNEQDRANALSSLGWAHYDMGQFSTAIQYWQDALDIYRQLGDRYGEGDLLGGLGWVSYLMGAYDEALEHIQQSFLVFGEVGNQLHRIGVNIGDSGVIRVAQQDYGQAVSNLRESLSIAEATNSINEKSYKGGYLAMALLFSGDAQAAEVVARQAVQYDVPANRHFVAAVHGITLARLGRVDGAIQAFEASINYAENILRFTSGLYNARYAHALSLAGLSLLREDNEEAAIEDYGRAKAMCSTIGVLDLNRRLLHALDPENQLKAVHEILK